MEGVWELPGPIYCLQPLSPTCIPYIFSILTGFYGFGAKDYKTHSRLLVWGNKKNGCHILKAKVVLFDMFQNIFSSLPPNPVISVKCPLLHFKIQQIVDQEFSTGPQTSSVIKILGSSKVAYSLVIFWLYSMAWIIYPRSCFNKRCYFIILNKCISKEAMFPLVPFSYFCLVSKIAYFQISSQLQKSFKRELSCGWLSVLASPGIPYGKNTI